MTKSGDCRITANAYEEHHLTSIIVGWLEESALPRPALSMQHKPTQSATNVACPV